MIDYKIIGSRIKQQRTLCKKTQANMAESLNVSIGYVSQIERGITKVGLDRLSEIAEYLCCDISLLLDGASYNSATYLDSEFNQLYRKLNAKDRKLLYELLKTYLTNSF